MRVVHRVRLLPNKYILRWSAWHPPKRGTQEFAGRANWSTPQGSPPIIKQPLKALILIFLWGALLEDAILFLVSWLAPEIWFRLFHDAAPASLDVAFLRRSGGQWAAFALAQAIALWQWRKQPVWLAVVAGVRFSDLFTDISYILAVPSLTTLGWCLLTPPPFLNFIGVAIMLLGYRQAHAHTPSNSQ